MTTISFLRSLLFCLFLSTVVWSEEQAWKYPLEIEFEGVKVQILNWEFAQKKRMLIVHAALKSQSRDEVYFPWQELFTMETADERRFRPNYDALVDRNGAGLTRTVGDFPLAAGRKARLSVLFLLGEKDLPARLLLPDGRRSILIR